MTWLNDCAIDHIVVLHVGLGIGAFFMGLFALLMFWISARRNKEDGNV